MNNLKTLKERLQIVLNNSTQGSDYAEAIEDAIYGCDLSEKGLTNWIDTWCGSQDVDYIYGGQFNKEYQHGVQFVSNVWDKIKELGDEEWNT